MSRNDPNSCLLVGAGASLILVILSAFGFMPAGEILWPGLSKELALGVLQFEPILSQLTLKILNVLCSCATCN